MDIESRIERLSESRDYRVVRFSAEWPMRYVGEVNADFGPQVSEGTEIEVHCHVDEDDGLDERHSRLFAVAEGREVWLCVHVMSRVREAC